MVEVPDDIRDKAKAANNGTLFLDRRTKSYKVIDNWAQSVDPAQLVDVFEH